MDLEDEDIGEDLHREIRVYGRKTMKLLIASNVLVSGMQGLGAEIAKNLILTGLKSVTLHDEGTVAWWDLSGSYVLSASDVRKNRAEASLRKLQELNKRVCVTTLSGKLTKEQLSNFQAVVFTASDLKTAIEFNDYCHNHQPPIPFIKADVNGLFGNVFCDFGHEFTVADVDGEEPHTGIISDITNDDSHGVLVSCARDEKLQFQDGDFVVFSEIHGMKELNDNKPRKIRICSPYSFFVEEHNTTRFGKYEKGGIVTQVKQPKVLNFRPLREILDDPKEFLRIDCSKPDHPPVLHLAFKALDEFISEMRRFPTAGSEEDALKFTSIAQAINDRSTGSECKLKDIMPELLIDFSYGAKVVLSPMATMFGGIAAQEVIKACSGMFHPIFQLFYFDSIESLSMEALKLEQRRGLNRRYDAQISVFGSKFQEKLHEAHTFIVGCGSLGCEVLKNLALMGVSCRDRGTLTVADDAIVKKNNLSTGVLFHKNNIGMPKAVIAAYITGWINPEFSMTNLLKRVGPETRDVFDIAFWDNLDVVISTVNDGGSRIYVGGRCERFYKPLLVSGAIGAKCSTQVAIPKATEKYGLSMDLLAEKEMGETTLIYIPWKIHHCVTWAMSVFEELLDTPVQSVNAYLEYPSSYDSTIITTDDSEILNIILNWLPMERCVFNDCIIWACHLFEDYLANEEKKMVERSHVLKTNSGTLFWSPPFTHYNPSDVSFVLAASILRAKIFHIPVSDWAKDFEKMDQAVEKITNIVRDFKPEQVATGNVNDAPSSSMNGVFKKLEQCRKSFPTSSRLKPIHFDKDDSTNYHIDFIAGLANMKARNYNIPEVDKPTIKALAGRFIPKIATCASTSVAAGLVCLELYKVVDGNHYSPEGYRNTFANLAIPRFFMAQPLRPKVHHQHHPNTRLRWTTWDYWYIQNKPTLGEIITCLETDKRVHVYEVTYEDYMIYSTSSPYHKYLRTQNVVDLVREYANVDENILYVTIGCLDDARNPVVVPPLHIDLRQLPLD